MNTTSEDPITRARELGLPTNLREAVGDSVGITAGEGPSSDDYERWLATRPALKYALEHASFSKGDGYEIWRNAWLILRNAYETAQRSGTANKSRVKAEEVILREAILGVIDGGDRVLLAEWNFYDRRSDRFSDNQRLDFADAVVRRVKEIKQTD